MSEWVSERKLHNKNAGRTAFFPFEMYGNFDPNASDVPEYPFSDLMATGAVAITERKNNFGICIAIIFATTSMTTTMTTNSYVYYLFT